MTRTKQAFENFREKYPSRDCRREPENDGQKLQMSDSDGLKQWVDGTGPAQKSESPRLEKKPSDLHLWAVRPIDVVHAAEECHYGRNLESRVIKHSNLTGTNPANCAGELVFIDNNTIALNGGSGRYGPESEDEMTAVAKAFRESGYAVWNYGYDLENDFPFRFGSRIPDWVE